MTNFITIPSQRKMDQYSIILDSVKLALTDGETRRFIGNLILSHMLNQPQLTEEMSLSYDAYRAAEITLEDIREDIYPQRIKELCTDLINFFQTREWNIIYD